jgi:ABC-type dipeptide/oligopeptide/nickel transport system permease subunit
VSPLHVCLVVIAVLLGCIAGFVSLITDHILERDAWRLDGASR